MHHWLQKLKYLYVLGFIWSVISFGEISSWDAINYYEDLFRCYNANFTQKQVNTLTNALLDQGWGLHDFFNDIMQKDTVAIQQKISTAFRINQFDWLDIYENMFNIVQTDALHNPQSVYSINGDAKFVHYCNSAQSNMFWLPKQMHTRSVEIVKSRDRKTTATTFYDIEGHWLFKEGCWSYHVIHNGGNKIFIGESLYEFNEKLKKSIAKMLMHKICVNNGPLIIKLLVELITTKNRYEKKEVWNHELIQEYKYIFDRNALGSLIEGKESGENMKKIHNVFLNKFREKSTDQEQSDRETEQYIKFFTQRQKDIMKIQQLNKHWNMLQRKCNKKLKPFQKLNVDTL